MMKKINKKLKNTNLHLINEREDSSEIHRKLLNARLKEYNLEYEDLKNSTICAELDSIERNDDD